LNYSDCIFERFGGYGSFADNVAEVPTNSEVTKVPQFPMNKIKWDAMPETLDEHIKRGIVEAS
jgi:hypothetical protein